MPESQQFFASCPKGIEDLLATELLSLGIQNPVASSAGASFEGGLQAAYKACLWSRLASRILMPLLSFEAKDEDELYKQVQSIDWSEHLHIDGTLAVNAQLSHSDLTNSHYAELKGKDAIVDQFMELYEERTSVDRDNPDLSVNLYIHRNHATLSIDLAGDSLHKRGYRKFSVTAPMKENLAAAVLMRSGWPNESLTLVDLMCGSGTLLIEAGLMALNVAPGLNREQFGFERWKGHKADVWQSLLAEAKQQNVDEQITEKLTIRGYDESQTAVK